MKSPYIMLRTCTIAVAFLWLGSRAVGQPKPQAQFTTTPTAKKQIVVELVYNYELADYTPPVPVRALSSSAEAVYTSPEGAVIANLSAMLAKDWQWFIDGWTAASAKGIEADLLKQNLTHQQMVNKWDMFKKGEKELVSRIKTGDFVIITYTTGAGGKMFAVVKRENGLWHLTNELSDDPILTVGLKLVFDNNGTAVIKRVVR